MSKAITSSPRQRFLNFIAADSLKARLVRGGLGSAAIQASSRVLSIALSILLARTLGAEGYGVYAFAFAGMTLLMVLAQAGVPTLLMREVTASEVRGDWGLLRGVLRRGGQIVALVASGVSLIGLLMLWAVGDRFEPTMFYTMAVVLLVLPLSAGTTTIAHALKGLRWVVLGEAVKQLFRPALALILISVLFVLSPELRQPQYAMVGQLIAVMVVVLVGAWLLRRLMPTSARTVTPIYRNREWLRSAIPFMLIGGTRVINSQTDILMLGWMTGSEEVGIYRVATQAAMLVVFGLQVVHAVVAPHFSRLYAQRDMARLQRLVTQSARAILLAALPLSLVFILAGEIVLELLFGTEFAAAHAPLAILAVGQLVNAGFGSVGILLAMTGHELDTVRGLSIAAVLNIVLNLVLIPLFGMEGAAVSSAVTLVIWNLILRSYVSKRLGIESSAVGRRA